MIGLADTAISYFLITTFSIFLSVNGMGPFVHTLSETSTSGTEGEKGSGLGMKLFFPLLLFGIFAKDATAEPLPFSTNATHITVWNGEAYVPLFIKGVNLGVGIPGTFPGEMAASRNQYREWFEQMRDAGFNTIRVYTLHFPRFYEELRAYNLANPNTPLLLFQGVWMEEELAGYDEDLFELTDFFNQEMQENVRAVHGDISIAPRQGKASGNYTADVSPWVIAYIIGREVMPEEVKHTNETHPQVTSYNGVYLSIANTNATEAWFIERLDRLIQFEKSRYNTMRPVSFSSWPTLDPFDHPEEWNRNEDLVGLDISTVDFSKAPAGIFASYHIYPYYPDFISRDPRYTSTYDAFGQNSYLAYLTAMKEHYSRFPLIIAEYGAPSSWGTAHYAQNGIHHGGYDEATSGEHAMRLLQNTAQSGTGGGILFAWIDEWFKRTWIVDPFDFLTERRIIWHNVTSAEQNYGLIGFRREGDYKELVETFCADCPVKSLVAGADFTYLTLTVNMDRHLGVLDTLWISLDTYDASLGESILPNGRTVSNRAEFALLITNYKAELYVTESYDTYGIWHNVSPPEYLYRSTATNGRPWKIVRWKNNIFENEVQYIGSMKVNRLDIPKSSLDAVRLYNDRVEIRLPWTLINFVDPSQAVVLHDFRNTPDRETLNSDGIAFGIQYKNTFFETSGRYLWEFWNHALNAVPYEKDSYAIVKERQRLLPGNPIAVKDDIAVNAAEITSISASNGVLANDFSFDGTSLSATLTTTPRNGLLNLDEDGGFRYQPSYGFTGIDTFTYRVKAGIHWSEPVSVILNVGGTLDGDGFVTLYPNPSSRSITVRSKAVLDRIELHDVLGRHITTLLPGALMATVDLTRVPSGIYIVTLVSGSQTIHRKLTRIH